MFRIPIKLSITLVILFILSIYGNGQPKSYQDLISEAKGKDQIIEKENESQNQEKPITPPVVTKFWCDPSLKLNSVRQDVMKANNYHKVMYRYKYFILYVTATWCDYCCQHEKELLALKQLLLQKTFEGEEIPIVQIQSDTDLDALKELKVGFFKVPSLYFVKEKQFYQYNSFWKAHNILRFINNLLNPVVELHSIEDVEKFFDTETNFVEKNSFLGDTVLEIPEETDHHYRNRMIAFFSDVEEYSADYSQFLSLAEKVSHRNDLRMGIITDKEIVRHFKQIYDGIWFNSHSWNSVVLKRIDKYYFLDLSLLNEFLETFVVYNSVSYIDELSNNNNFITSKIVTPIALFFIDSTFILPNFHSQLKFLINISKKYTGKYVFMYMDGNVKSKTKELLGLKKESPLPTLVINYISSQKHKQLPYQTPYNDINIMKFLNENYQAKISGSDLDDLKEKIVQSYDDKIVRNLKLTTKIEAKNVAKVINNRKYDVVVFTVDTDYDQTTETLSKYISKLCERFRTLGIKSVLFTIFDINENGLFNFEGVNYKPGDILMFPASSKKKIQFRENLTLLRLMKWIEKNVDLKIRLPEIPHIDLDMQEEYYRRKSIMESYDENSLKTDLEIDDSLKMEFETQRSAEEKKIEL